jgi:hypothetical protein
MHPKPSYTARKARKPQGKPIVTIHAAPPVLASFIASVEKRWSVTLAHKESRHA